MRSEQKYEKRIHHLPEFRDVVLKLLQFMKVNGYNIVFKTDQRNCKLLLINERDPSEEYVIGDVYEIIDEYLLEENKRKEKLDYTRVFSLIQDILDEFIYRIKNIKDTEVFFVAQKVKYLVFLRSFFNLLIKVENYKSNKVITVSDDSVKIDGKPVYVMQQNMIYTTSPLRYLYMELLEIYPDIIYN